MATELLYEDLEYAEGSAIDLYSVDIGEISGGFAERMRKDPPSDTDGDVSPYMISTDAIAATGTGGIGDAMEEKSPYVSDGGSPSTNIKEKSSLILLGDWLHLIFDKPT